LVLCVFFLRMLWSPLRKIRRVQLTFRRKTCFVLLCLFVL
jgi:hypothetical protein